MTRVLFVTPYFAPAWGYGGPPRINYDLARYLVNQGFEVEVATTDALDGKQRAELLEETLDNIRITRFRNVNNWLAWQGKLFFPIGFGAWLDSNITRFDFVYLSDFRDVQNAIAYQLCLKHDIPYAVAAYGELALGNNFRTPFKKLYDALWGRRLLRGARYLLAQTEHEAHLYMEFGGSSNQTVLLPLGIDKRQFRRPSGQAFREQYGILKDEQVLLFVGRIDYLKGIDFLVTALAEIRRLHPNTRLMIVGRDDAYYLVRLRKLIDRFNLTAAVTFTGPLYGTESYGAYAAADLFVFTPRHYEETSLACLTSLALGTPVITTDQAGIPHLDEAGAGYQIERDLTAFVEKVNSLLGEPQKLKAMGRRGQDLIARVFDLEKVGARLEQLIREVTNG